MFVKHRYSKYWQENNIHAVLFSWGWGSKYPSYKERFVYFDLNRTFHRKLNQEIKVTRCPPNVMSEDP